MKAKKLLATILAAMLALSSFSACTAAPEESSSSKEESKSSTSETSKEETEGNKPLMDGDIEISGPGELPIVLGDKINMSVFTTYALEQNSEFGYEDNTFSKILEDSTNIHLEWSVTSKADKSAKLNLLFQSNDYDDIIFNSGWDGSTIYSYAKQGFLVPISDYLEDHAHYYNIWYDAIIDNDVATVEEMNANVMPDGKIYSFVKVSPTYASKYQTRFWVYEPWLETLDIEMPTTTEEFEKMLVAFKNEDPNGNGKADEIPLTGAIDGWNQDPTEFLMNSFLYYQKVDKIYVDNGVPTYVFTKDEYKEGIKWLNSLADQGLLLDDTFTQGKNEVRALTTQDVQLVGSAAGGQISNVTTVFNNEEGDWANWTALPPLEGPEGVRYARYTPIKPAVGANITNNCEYPIAAFKMLEYLYEEEISIISTDGIEGVGWRYAEEGEVGLNGATPRFLGKNPGAEGITNYAWGTICHAGTFPSWGYAEVVLGDPELDQQSINDAAARKYEAYAPSEDMIMPTIVLDEETSREYASIKTAIFSVESEYFTDAIINGFSEEKWDAFQQTLIDGDIERLNEINKQAYDEVMAKGK